MVPKKVLLVDDSEIVRQQVRTALVSRGFQVIEAAEGKEGLARMREHGDLAVVLCDIDMPLMTGMELVAAAQAEGLTTPIVMLTSEGQPSQIRRAREAGAKGWIIKPFNVDLLVAAINKLSGPGDVSKT